ncbi:DNA-binding MarR family transcriptional regulator [Streptosporangium album]|uniref:DNA-binding MarR family transcriptional regulator n=1 Tax=Streptosporangium album TaxID=47479 RepID=A0A7W7S5P6_9ACTN|nr:MarR family transcriptional regulator [Streptosporangium album]MBB4944358.1 DNA-binding MarR family transcriptional regulator [Streptosporangium album]
MSHDPQVAARVWHGMRALVLDRHDRRKEVCAALDMSFIRAKALRRLASTPLTMRQLAAELATDAPYTTIVVDDLVRRGMVVRDVHPDDRRQKIVTVTADGARAAELAEAILGEPPPPLLELGDADLMALDRIITGLLG